MHWSGMTKPITGTTTMRSALILAAVVLLAGCAVGPDYERPNIDLPKSAFDSTSA